MKDARTGIDPTLILATRWQMWAQGLRIKISITLAGAVIGFFVLFSFKPPFAGRHAFLENRTAIHHVGCI